MRNAHPRSSGKQIGALCASAICSILAAASRVRTAAEASGSCTLAIRYPLSCEGMNPVGSWR